MATIGILLAFLFLPSWAAAEAPPAAPHPLAAFIQAELALNGPIHVPDGRPVVPGEAVAQFYAAHAHTPAWTDGARFEALLTELDALTDDGLVPRDYLADVLPALRAGAGPSYAAHARVDLLATHALLEALTHLRRGRLPPERTEPMWRLYGEPAATEPAPAVLRDAVEAGDIAGLFEAARPSHPIYGALRQGLRALRAVAATGGWPHVPSGPTLKPGMRDPRVPTLRARLAAARLPSATLGSDDRFDEALADAVRRFQFEQFLTPDAAVGRATLAALNAPVEERIDQLRANLERARWLLRELQGDLVLVDIAGFGITYFRGSRPVWRARVQVGRPYRSTPMLRSEITHFTFNPAWTVPPTILREDVLPKVREDPGHLARQNMRVLDRHGNELDPALVDWNAPGGVLLRQDAGATNALGRVAIRFPNPHSVYLHDTPNQRLFERGARAFSSGCIRVENPLELVELLFDDPERWNRAEIDALLATGETRDVLLPRRVPILLLYWTVHVHESGRLGFKPDIYGRDAPLIKALDAPAD